MPAEDDEGAALDAWIREVCAALDLPPDLAEHRQLLLDVARDAAHGVMRPAAPLTTFLVGFAAGRAADPAQALPQAAATVTAMANARPPLG
jgi:hypothetical protein